MSEKPKQCTKCCGRQILPIPEWRGTGWQCGICGEIYGCVFQMKDTKSGKDIREDYY